MRGTAKPNSLFDLPRVIFCSPQINTTLASTGVEKSFRNNLEAHSESQPT